MDTPGTTPTRFDPLRGATIVAVLSLGAGFAVLVAYCIAESVSSGLSLGDAYWRGRLPWMGIAEGLIVGGATATLLVGGVATLVLGGWWRRAALVPLLTVAAFWWFAAASGAGIGGGPCIGPCPPRPIDPWAYAYSLPETAFAFLILPSFAVAWLALARRPHRS